MGQMLQGKSSCASHDGSSPYLAVSTAVLTLNTRATGKLL